MPLSTAMPRQKQRFKNDRFFLKTYTKTFCRFLRDHGKPSAAYSRRKRREKALADKTFCFFSIKVNNMNRFDDFKLSDNTMEAIRRFGYTKPTEIQNKSIPATVEGRDVLGESATGSGKTLAFGCGIVEQVNPGKGIQALVLTPTRELAEQVKDSLQALAMKRLRIIAVYGGVGIEPQIKGLQKADVVIATPGRFKDHQERGTIDTSRISILVLDEADRMLDMGFIDDIEDIIRTLPKKRQNMLFSATLLPEIRELASKYLSNPVKAFVDNQVDPSKLRQYYYDVPRGLKLGLLAHLIKHETANLIMIFCNTRRATDIVASNLTANGIDAIALHGGFAQNKRTKAMDLLKAGRKTILVCTDVAARGIDIENISHIYNYDIPSDPTDYVHRIGRTARAGEEGKVINLLCEQDYENFGRLERDHSEFKIEKLKRPYVQRLVVQQQDRRSGNGPRRGPPGRGPKRGSFRHRRR